jgi:hypothetical protein
MMKAHHPRNGRHFVALLIGGEHVPVELSSELFEEYGIAIEHRWTSARQMGPLPKGCDCVLIMTDLSSHEMQREATRLAKGAAIPYALIGRKKAAWMNGLALCGFVQRPSWLKPHGPKKEIVMTPATNGVNGAALFEPTPAVKHAPQPRPTNPLEAPKVAAAPVVVATPAPVPQVDTTQRYVRPGFAWTDEECQAVFKVLDKWPTDRPGEDMVVAVWKATGIYRSPRALAAQIRALRMLWGMERSIALARTLDRVVTMQRGARKEFLAAEEAAQARGELPLWVSLDLATKLVGGDAKMIRSGVHVDRRTSLFVVPRDVLLPILQARRDAGIADGVRGHGHAHNPTVMRDKILARVSKGPVPRSAFRAKFAGPAIDGLIRDGLIQFHMGSGWLTLPGVSIEPKPKPEPKPAAVKPQPESSADNGLRGQIFRALRAGEITPKDAAAMLREIGVDA